MVLISAILPRIMLNEIAFMSSATLFFRKDVAPTPTGSRTTGIPFVFAALPASTIEARVRSFAVPIFKTSASQMPTISATSSISSAIIGEAPMAKTTLAQSLTVT
jgi:hypothetical protein